MLIRLTAMLMMCACRPTRASMMDWLFASDSDPKTPDLAPVDRADGARPVPFEVLSADDKFLSSVKRLTSLEFSDLDMCQHKIFLTLHKSCSQLSEEDMAKVSVQLLNCQSEAEKRPVYTCTADMTIAACTRHMDANTWNAYHIVSNRARAVCYAARQQQFRASTELAVNRLAAQTFRQLEGMQQLEGSQRALEKLTGDTMQRVARGQEDLLSQHSQLRVAQASIQSHVVDNLRELGRVRSAISVGQMGVSHTLQQIRAGLQQAGDQLSQHEVAHNRSQHQLAADLERIRASAVHLLDRLESVDDTTRAVVGRFDALMESLERMNGTIFTLLSTLDTTQRQVDQKLGWLIEALGSDLHLVMGVVLHTGFLLLGMLLLAFLQAPYAVRLGLLLLVPLNLLSLLQNGPTLEFSAITTALIIIGVGHHLTVWLYRRYGGHVDVDAVPAALRGPSLTTEKSSHHMTPAELSRVSTRDVNSSDSDEQPERGASGGVTTSSARVPLRREMGRASPMRQRVPSPGLPWERAPLSPLLNSSAAGPSSPLDSSLNNSVRHRRLGVSERPWCAALCRNGLRCRNPAGYLSPYCGVHVHVRESRESTPVGMDSS